MKKLIPLLMIVLVLSVSAMFAPHEDLEIGPGSRMTYSVVAGEANYDFITSIINTEGTIEFDYEMTTAEGIQGKVIMMPDAVENGRIQNNYFNGGLMVLEDATTVWVSKSVYTEFKAGQTTIFNDDESETLSLVDNITMIVNIHGEPHELPVLYGETDRANKYWILDNPNIPLILKMDLGWSITIREIE